MKKLSLLMISSVLMFSSGCATTSNQTKGTIAGGAVGAGVGALAGNSIKGISTTEGAIAGTLIGGLIGNVMGRQQDQISAQNDQIGAVAQQANQQIINVVNSNGSIMPVTLIRSGNQWQGPRGEFYANLPTPEQLSSVYGF